MRLPLQFVHAGLTLLAAEALVPGARAQLTPPYVPPQNPVTPAKVALGKILFWDEQVSSDGSVACGTCHLPEFGGSDGRLGVGLHPGRDGSFGTADDVRGSAGVVRQTHAGEFVPGPVFGLRRQATARTSPSMIMGAFHHDLFWDGRAANEFLDPETGLSLIPIGGALESQAVGPILSPVEMGVQGRTWQDVRSKLQAVTPLALASNLPPDVVAALQQSPTYPALFTAAFGSPWISASRIAMAIASYERTLVPDDTPWDRFMNGQTSAMTQAEKSGWIVFQNQGRCTACHTDPLFSDDAYHNLGVRWSNEDIGRGLISGNAFDVAAFKTPSLRNAGLRPRLFHGGSSPALGDPAQWTDPASTLNVYFNGHGVDPSNLDPALVPLGQLAVPIADVALALDFVRTALTDARVAQALPPFDHPTLRSAAVPPPRVFGQALAGGSEPFLIDALPSHPGNADYRIGLVGGTGAAPALLTWGLSSIEPGITVLGMPWQLNAIGWFPFTLQPFAGQPSAATWHLPLPNDPALAPIPFYFQLFVLDAQAPGGIAASRGWEMFVR